MGKLRERRQRSVIQVFWWIAVLLALAAAITYLLSPLFAFMYGSVVVRLLVLAGLLIALLAYRNPFGKWRERALFGFVAVVGCYVVWENLRREERTWLFTGLVLVAVMGAPLGAVFLFKFLRVKLSEWQDLRSHKRDPTSRDAYAAWLRKWDEKSQQGRGEARDETRIEHP
jgi:hypothetical protein